MVHDGLVPPWEQLDATAGDLVTLEIQLRLSKLPFPQVGGQASPLLSLQHQYEGWPVLLHPFAEDEDVTR